VTKPTAPAYRHELDGLRAIAVLAVLGYHAGYNDFAGGFMGVDVFLVLSGYLITQKITAALSEDRFHPGRFWLRRVRRLLPAMLPVLGFALISALLLKGQGAFEEFAGHFLSAGFFYSNYQFLSEADYFARASDTNLLLHTWSLSLEWQFYLVTPVVLMAVHRFGRLGRLIALTLLAAGSLAFAEYLIATGRGSWAFFGVMPRFWEFAAGGIVALLPPFLSRVPLVGAGLRAVGLGLVLWAIFGGAPARFPGLGAAWAVLGTSIVLLAPIQSRDPVRWLLERRPMLWVGVRSYAIYLIHWPLFVTVTPANMGQSEDVLSVALLASLFLGHLIYRYVETPVRSGARFRSSSAILRSAGPVLAMVALTGLTLPTGVGVTLRAALPLSGLRTAMTEIDTARAEYLALMDDLQAGAFPGIRYCSFDDIADAGSMVECLSTAPPGERPLLLVGDSHGRDVLMALTRAFPDQPVVMLHQSSCVPATYIRGRSLCFPELEQVLTQAVAEAGLTRVMLASRWWQGEHEGAQATLAVLERLGAEIIVIGPGPTFDTPMEGFVQSAAFSGEDPAALPPQGPDRFAFDVAAVNTDLRTYADTFGARFIDRFALLCDDSACPVQDGPLLYFDEQHLSPAGLDLLAGAFRRAPGLSFALTAP
jgi:peptidoglycan/LPS O-acetylase OafA/YrhL